MAKYFPKNVPDFCDTYWDITEIMVGGLGVRSEAEKVLNAHVKHCKQCSAAKQTVSQITQSWIDWYDGQNDDDFLKLRKSDISQMSFYAGAKISFEADSFIMVIDKEIKWHEERPVQEVNENYRIGFLAGLRHLRNLAAAQHGVNQT